MDEDKKPERPESTHSSDKEGVSDSPSSPKAINTLPKAQTNAGAPLQDSFEDASEITPRPEPRSERSQSRSRSLLGKRESTDTTAQEPKADSPAPEVPQLPSGANDEADDTKGEVEATEASTGMAPPAKSPLLTAHRISVTSDMDDVSLEEDGTKAPNLLPKLPPRDSRDSTASASGLQGLSGQMSPVKYPPPPPPPVFQEKPPRRLHSSKKPGSPPLPLADRRNTNASIQSLGSNPELTLSRIDDEDDQKGNNRSSQGSLRDRFKALRMREEAGITMNDETIGEGGLGITSPGSLVEKEAVTKEAEPVDWDLWQSVVNEGPTVIAQTSPEELNRAVANGIPQVIRGVIWQVLAQSKNEALELQYKELVARGTDKEHMSVQGHAHTNGNGKERDSIASSASSIHSDYSTPATTTGSANAPLGSPSTMSETSEDPMKYQARLAAEKKDKTAAIIKLEKTIKRDLVARTSYSKYLMAAGLQDGLFGICKAYALYDEAVGYAQGMNFIAMPLLFNMPEEEAFSLFVTLMNKYGLRDLFVADMAGLHLHLHQFERLLEEFEPALYCHLHRREVKPQLYATQWFLTLFAYRFPLQLVVRIYDLILSDGLEAAILKFGLVLMQKNAETLLGMKDMATLTNFLKEKLFDVYIDKAPSANSILEMGSLDQLVRDAVAVKITPEMLKEYTAEWKEQQRIEKDRETELQGLKEKTAALETKLIKTKVENEQLAEENETLKTKVEELQKIVDTQPERSREETEERDGNSLEEQMAEMEQELVDTKMKWATINEEHETLKQKWNNISQMMR
ncbi:RabGAP/TBC [Lizonia empirigonia]|nr:RabGAP/TBC [Lizonia empirigonia]